MNTSKCFLSTLIAAAAMSANAWAVGEIISLNFGKSANAVTETLTGTAGLATYDIGGVATYVSAKGWTNVLGDKSGAASDVKNYTGDSISGASVSWSSPQSSWGPPNGGHDTATLLGMIQSSYLDLGASNQWNVVVETPFLVCDVYIYLSGDGEQYSPVEVNGVSYIGGTDIVGGGSWGDRSTNASKEMTLSDDSSSGNVIKLTSQSGVLSLSNVSQWTTSARATLSALQVVNTYGGVAMGVELAEDAVWTDEFLAGKSWTNSTVESGVYTSFKVSAETSLRVDGDSIKTDGIVVSGSGELTISGNKLTFLNAGVIRTDSDASVTISNDLVFSAYGNISGAVTLSGNLEFSNGGFVGAGVSFGDSTGIALNGGTLSLSSMPAGGISIAKDAVLNLQANNVALDISRVSGSGTVMYTFTGNGGESGLKTSDTFTGKVDYVGNLNWSDAQYGKPDQVSIGNSDMTLKLSSRFGSADGMWGRDNKTFQNDVEFGTNYKIYVQQANLTFAGSVVAENVTLTLEGSKELAFEGAVNVGTLTGGNGVVKFSGKQKKTIGTLSAADRQVIVNDGELIVNGGMIGTLTGNGVLTDKASTQSVVSNFDGWTGTIVLGGSSLKDLSKAGVSGSNLNVNGLEKSFLSDATLSADISVGELGWVINNGSSSNAATAGVFEGKISGSGDITFNKWNTTSSQTGGYKFTGNMTEFSGKVTYNQANQLDFGVGGSYAGTDNDKVEIVQNITGTGEIEITTSASLNFNYAASEKYDVLAIGNSVIKASNSIVTLQGGASYLISAREFNAKELRIESETVEFSGEGERTVGTLSASGKAVTVNGGELSITTSADIGTLSVGDSGMTLSGAGTKTVGTLSASGKTVTVNGGELSITTSATIGTLSIGAGAAVNISGGSTITGTFSGAGSLNVEDGGALELVGANGDSGNSTNQTAGTINVNGGGTLKFSGHDLMGWDGFANVAAVLQGESAEKVATLYIDDSGSAAGLTFSRSIEMKGNAKVSTNLESGKLNSFHGKITASGTNNKIENLTIMVRENLEVEVSGKEDVLSISGSIVSHKNAQGNTEGAGVFNKTGDGVLILSGDNSGLTTDKDGNKRVISVSQGTLVAAHANALGSGKVTVAKGATLGFVAGTTVTGVTGGIELADGAKLAIDLSKYDLSQYPLPSSGENSQISLDLVSGVAIKYNNELVDSSNVGDIAYELVGWEKYANLGWTSSLAYVGNNLQLTLTIPEPSTFGLLAGLGALTLVGTRRRRKKA